MIAAGFDCTERLEINSLSTAEKRRPLQRLGIRSGEILTLGRAGHERHFELPGKKTREGT